MEEMKWVGRVLGCCREGVWRGENGVKDLHAGFYGSFSWSNGVSGGCKRISKFEIGEAVLLKVSPWKGLIRFGKKGKLAPRYIGPFEILNQVGKVAYELALPPQYQHVHNVFHVSLLKRYNPDANHVIEIEPVEIQADLSYEKQPVQILDQQERTLRNKSVSLVKVLWRNPKFEEAMWELESEMQNRYPQLFS
ncbi:uncharacterized protein LOC141660517 [Apium graveolens]|uniref:uncharacterized protein LOC141660517 n=1 Tax=Apium graveolens TaxID=4045 RepID=UPI003D7AC3BF